MIINTFVYFNINININKKYLKFVLLIHFTVMIILLMDIINIISNISSLQIIITDNMIKII